MLSIVWTTWLGFVPWFSLAYLIGNSAKPRWDVDMSEGPIAFLDMSLCMPDAARIRSVEFFAPVLGHIESLYIQVWRLRHGQLHTLKAQSLLQGWTARGGIFSAPLDLLADSGDCIGWTYNRSGGGVIGFWHGNAEDKMHGNLVNSVRFSRGLAWPPILESTADFQQHDRREYAIRFDLEPPSCWIHGKSWMSCCGPARSGTRIVPACWPGDLEMHLSCCGESHSNDLHNTETLTTGQLGNPHCFSGQDQEIYNYQLCCDRQYGPEGNTSCWDGLMDFHYCCRPALPTPQRDARCWQGTLQHQHERCCHGAKQAEGPRGSPLCWMQSDAAEASAPPLDAMRCCDSFKPYSSAVGRCLLQGHATTCSLPGVAFRQLTAADLHYAHSHNVYPLTEDPLLWAVPMPRKISEAHLLFLGVGRFIKSTTILEKEARQLGIFKKIHTYTDFSFVDSTGVWSKHIDAWQTGARIAGFGWWKPVLCRRHLAALPKNGLLIFSDAGSRFRQEAASTWRSVLAAMQHFDVLAVVETDFIERRFTKRLTMERFGHALRGTVAADEGQFVSRLMVFRRTLAAERLLKAWEQLVRNINLVDESLHPRGEDGFFQAHRHEQSVLSLLLKCAILGRSMKIGRMTNLSARVLVLRSDVEGTQLMEFARRKG